MDASHDEMAALAKIEIQRNPIQCVCDRDFMRIDLEKVSQISAKKNFIVRGRSQNEGV